MTLRFRTHQGLVLSDMNTVVFSLQSDQAVSAGKGEEEEEKRSQQKQKQETETPEGTFKHF